MEGWAVGAATTVGLAAVGAVTWLIRRYIDRGFDQGIEKFRIETQAIHDAEIERLRTELQQSAFEHQTRFQGLYERRTEVLANLHEKLVAAYRAFQSWTNIVQMGGEPSLEEKGRVARDAGNDFIDYFERHRIWLPLELCEDLTRFALLLRDVGVDFAMREQGAEYWRKVFHTMSEEVPALREAIDARPDR